jgi:hypothetical protein
VGNCGNCGPQRVRVLSAGPRAKRKKEENRKRYKMDEEPVVNSPRNQFLFTTLIVPQPSDSSVPNIVNEITEREVSPTLTQRNDRLVPLREEAQPPRYSTIVKHCPKTEKPQLCVPRVLPASPSEEASVQWCVTFDCVFPLRYPTHQQNPTNNRGNDNLPLQPPEECWIRFN